ncbi:hypothetical protein FCV25MIE_05578 [Fagus crenata]
MSRQSGADGRGMCGVPRCLCADNLQNHHIKGLELPDGPVNLVTIFRQYAARFRRTGQGLQIWLSVPGVQLQNVSVRFIPLTMALIVYDKANIIEIIPTPPGIFDNDNTSFEVANGVIYMNVPVDSNMVNQPHHNIN